MPALSVKRTCFLLQYLPFNIICNRIEPIFHWQKGKCKISKTWSKYNLNRNNMMHNLRNQTLIFAFPIIICGILFQCSLFHKYLEIMRLWDSLNCWATHIKVPLTAMAFFFSYYKKVP